MDHLGPTIGFPDFSVNDLDQGSAAPAHLKSLSMSKKVDTDGYTANAEPGAWKLVCKRGADCKDAAARRASFKLPSHCRPQKSLTRRSTRQIELTVRQLEILAYALRDVPLERSIGNSYSMCYAAVARFGIATWRTLCCACEVCATARPN
jgi:hypothetical protein